MTRELNPQTPGAAPAVDPVDTAAAEPAAPKARRSRTAQAAAAEPAADEAPAAGTPVSWKDRTSTEAQEAGVKVPVLCKDGWYVPETFGQKK